MKMNKLILLEILLVVITLSSCDSLKDLTYTVTPNPLEMHGDSVRVKIEVKVPEKGIGKKIVAEITPKLGNQTLDVVKVAGEKIKIGEKSIPFKSGGKVTYDKTYAYDPSFENTNLEINLKAYKGAIGAKEKKKEAIDSKIIAEGTIITPMLLQPNFKVVSLKQEYIQTKDDLIKATINYDKGRSELRPNEMKDADIVALKEWLKSNAGNSRIIIKNISINGYACPDGVESKNLTLSDNRVTTALKVIESLLKETKYSPVDLKTLSKNKGLGEDFEGFTSELNKSNLTAEDKSLISRVIKETTDLDTRERKIKEISKVYMEIEKDIFPRLRRAEIVITYSIVGPSNEELMSIGSTNPSSLKLDELIQAAELIKDAKTKQSIYTAALGIKADDKLVLNNLGVLMYDQGKYDEAKSYFEKSGKIESSAENRNNLASTAAKKGDFETARKLLEKNSLAAAKYNFGYFSIKRGRYTDAITAMKGENSFNLALAQLLNGKADEAIKTLDACETKETAEWFYLKAVANARLNNVEGTVSNLKSAIAKNSSLKEKARNDKEFRNFNANSSFTSLLN